MESIKLTSEQIVDLIFEKEISIDNIKIRAKDSCLGILSHLDNRLMDGKIFRSKNSVLRKRVDFKVSGNRKQSDEWVAFCSGAKANESIRNSL